MFDWEKMKEKWIVLIDEKKSHRGKNFFRKRLMNRSGNTICFWSDLDENGKVVFKIEMCNLDPKTGKSLSASPIWEQHEFATERELLDKVEELKQKY
jgi:hypothetical protein